MLHRLSLLTLTPHEQDYGPRRRIQFHHALDYNPVQNSPWISPHRFKKYKWLNLGRLAEIYAAISNDTVESVHYFTALASWNSTRVSRHQIYLDALKDVNVNVVLGQFKPRTKHCNACGQNFLTYEASELWIFITKCVSHI